MLAVCTLLYLQWPTGIDRREQVNRLPPPHSWLHFVAAPTRVVTYTAQPLSFPSASARSTTLLVSP